MTDFINPTMSSASSSFGFQAACAPIVCIMGGALTEDAVAATLMMNQGAPSICQSAMFLLFAACPLRKVAPR
ncbi:MAG: hypothetical protein R3E58_03015 [Phycisphaerae bacterium]